MSLSGGWLLCNCKLNMRVAIRSVLKSNYSHFQCFSDQQVIFRAGHNICIKTIGKPECEFIPLRKNIDKIYSFQAMTSCKGVFTAEQAGR